MSYARQRYRPQPALTPAQRLQVERIAASTPLDQRYAFILRLSSRLQRAVIASPFISDAALTAAINGALADVGRP